MVPLKKFQQNKSFRIILIWLIILHSSCDGGRILNSYDSQRADVVIINNSDPSIADSVIFFYPHGKIKGIVEYKNDIDQPKDGWTLTFDSLSGLLMNRILYSNGICRYFYDYYPNGTLKTISECFDQTEIGSKYIFDSLGILKKYDFYNFVQFNAYSKVYERNTSPYIIFQENSLISQYWFSTLYGEDVDIENGLLRGTEYYYYAAIPKPPDNDRIIEISEFDELNNRISKTILKDTTGIIQYPFMFDSKGYYKIVVKCKLINGLTHVVEWNDSVNYPLIIK